MVEKYRQELCEILDDLIAFRPSLQGPVGVPQLFNWRALFDFSSLFWEECDPADRIAIINALAEKGTLFLALMNFKNLYLEMNRPDIAGAAGLSLARFLEEISSFEFSLY